MNLESKMHCAILDWMETAYALHSAKRYRDRYYPGEINAALREAEMVNLTKSTDLADAARAYFTGPLPPHIYDVVMSRMIKSDLFDVISESERHE